MKRDESSVELVTVANAKNVAQAELICGLLHGAEIPVYLAGALLQDHWAMFQKLAGLLSVEVQVPKVRAIEAMEILREARESPLDENTDVETDRETETENAL